MRVWRLARLPFAPDGPAAYSGFGASLRGGRWNSRGVLLAYASISAALALTEYLAHVEWAQVPDDLAMFAADVPDDAIATLAHPPAGWDAQPFDHATVAVGDGFVRERSALALVVPSVVVPMERNVLINPAHARFNAIVFEKPEPFTVDPRLRPAVTAARGKRRASSVRGRKPQG